MRDARTDALAFAAFPETHCADVGEISPNPTAFLPLATVVVIDAHDEWQVTRRYLSDVSMDELREVITTKKAAEIYDAKPRIT